MQKIILWDLKKLDYSSSSVSGGFSPELELREATAVISPSPPFQSPLPFFLLSLFHCILSSPLLSFPHTRVMLVAVSYWTAVFHIVLSALSHLTLLYREENWGTKKWSHLPRIKQFMNGRARLHVFQEPRLLPFWCWPKVQSGKGWGNEEEECCIWLEREKFLFLPPQPHGFNNGSTSQHIQWKNPTEQELNFRFYEIFLIQAQNLKPVVTGNSKL